MDSIMSDAQLEAAEALRRPRLRDRVAALLSGSFPAGLDGLSQRDRDLVADHLEESARRALATDIRVDSLLFRMTLEEAAFTTPAVDMLRAIAAAVRAGDAKAAAVAGLDTPQRYGVSGLLEAARDRAQTEGAPHPVADACGRLWAAWDAWAGVSGSPAERSWHLAGRPKGVVVHD